MRKFLYNPYPILIFAHYRDPRINDINLSHNNTSASNGSAWECPIISFRIESGTT